MYNFSKFKESLESVLNWQDNEYASLRTGRATPTLLDGVLVDTYGTKTKISHVANMSIEDAKTLRITPWDKSSIKGIESAIQAANLGVSVIVDGEGIRVIFPDLTSERRKMMEKVVGEKCEQARISIKKEREAIWNNIVSKEKEGGLSEDEKYSAKEALQQIVDEYNNKLEERARKKVVELAQ